MSLHFIIGRSGSGKTQQCVHEILENKYARQILLVPEQFTSQAERDLVSQSRGQSILNSEVLSFGRLSYQIFSKNGIANRTPLNEIGKIMVLQKILLEQKENLPYFQNMMNKTGFLDQLSLTISEISQYEIPMEDFALAEGTSQTLADKTQDVRRIYESFQDFLAQDYLCTDTSLDLLSTSLATEATLFQNTAFWLDGFHGFTPQEMTVIGELLRLSARVSITLPMDEASYFSSFVPESAPFFTSVQTKKSITEMAQGTGISISAPLILRENHRAKNPALKNLEATYFAGFYKKCQLSQGVQIIACPSLQEEVACAAGKIVALAKDKGIRYREMAIVTNAMEQYENRIRSTLKQYDIPYFIDSRRDISAHPLLTFLHGLFDCLAYDFSYEGMFSYLKSGLTPLSQEDIDLLENYVLAYGIKGYKWTRPEWLYGRAKEGEEALQHMNGLRQRIMGYFAPFLQLEKNTPYPLERFTTALLSHLEALGIPETLSHWAEQAVEQNDLTKAEEHRQIWDMVMEVLESADGMLSKLELPLKEWIKILQAGLDKCTMGVIPSTTDCILVGDIERSRLPEIKVLFVLGANEGVLPAARQGQGLFTEQEREALAQKGIALAPNTRHALFEEQFLIYRGLTKPSHALFLTYACADAQGKELFPSSLVSKLCRMDEALSIQSFQAFALAESTTRSAFSKLGIQMKAAQDTNSGNLPPIWQDIYSFFAKHADWQTHLALLRGGLGKAKKLERLSPKTIKTLYSKDIFSSVSRLERFASCPFSFFVEYGLKAKERQLYQLHTPDLGILFHEVLEIFSNQIDTNGLDWNHLTLDQTTTLIHEAVDDAAPRLSNEILLDTAANQYLIRRLKRISTRAAWTLVQHMQSGSFTIGGYEVGFGPQQALPPIQIALSDGGSLVLSGKIDRVDYLDVDGKRYVKIIDYKSGSKSFDFQDIYYGLQLQLLVYLDAYLKHYEKTTQPVQTGGVFYFRINDPTIAVNEELSADKIQRLLYEKMQMSGLVLEDEVVMQGMDAVLEAGNLAGRSSAIIPVSFTKKGTPSAQAYLASEDQYDALLDFVVKRSREIGDEMKKGTIAPIPYKKGTSTPCTYCTYQSICRHGHGYEEGASWRNLKKLSKSEFWEHIAEETTEKP